MNSKQIEKQNKTKNKKIDLLLGGYTFRPLRLQAGQLAESRLGRAGSTTRQTRQSA
jgi:hypothetical protein